jgi:hypothetical protein
MGFCSTCLRKYIHVQPARMGNGIEIWVSQKFGEFQIERPEQVIDFLGMVMQLITFRIERR